MFSLVPNGAFSLFTLLLSFSFVHARPTEKVNSRFTEYSPSRQCQPGHWEFKSSSASLVASNNDLYSDAPFIALSGSNTYKFTDNGLELLLQKPHGTVTSKDGVNDKLGDGATMNSTFWMNSGSVTYELSAPYVPGVVSACILIDAAADGREMHRDEIDVELVGSGPYRWQTNIFKPSNEDPDPHYGHFGEKQTYPDGGSITDWHKYTISWNSERIQWGVDGEIVRTLSKGDTVINGQTHMPGEKDPLRLQVGIWDGSGAKGTSSWSGGPVNWDTAPEDIKATLRSITVEC